MEDGITAHGGKLIDLYVSDTQRPNEKASSSAYKSWDLTARQICDLELLLNGAFSPLTGFLNKADYEEVLSTMRLSDGTLWPMPINLDVTEEFASSISIGESVTLRDPEGVPIAILTVGDIWEADKLKEAQSVYSTTDESHPGVHHLMNKSNSYYLGGTVKGLSTPLHYDFKTFRHSPSELRQLMSNKGWKRVIAFQSRNPIHKAHVILSKRLMAEHNANFMIHAAVGMTKPGDIDPYCRVRCYQRIISRYPEGTAGLSLLPLAMRMAGPREALWQAIIRQNHGFTHFLVGRDHAGPGRNNRGGQFYPVEASQQLVIAHQHELEIEIIPLPFLLYSPSRGEFCEQDKLLPGEEGLYLSGTELRNILHEGNTIPSWFTYPEVITELHQSLPPKSEQGFTVFFTGFSGSGKSTLANGLVVKLRENGKRKVTLLDGDVVRKNLSSELNFSKEHRDINIRRIGFVAEEITKNRGIAVCAPIAPYAATRRAVKSMISEEGVFVEIHVSTPLEVCESRDRKGLYALARAGKIKEFTGISDPYEVPENPALRIDTSTCSMEEAVNTVYQCLVNLGLVEPLVE